MYLGYTECSLCAFEDNLKDYNFKIQPAILKEKSKCLLTNQSGMMTIVKINVMQKSAYGYKMQLNVVINVYNKYAMYLCECACVHTVSMSSCM